MPITLIDDPAHFPAVTAPVQSDALSTVDTRAGLQALADRTAAIVQNGEVKTLRGGTMAEMKALVFGAVVGGQLFVVYEYGIFEYVEAVANNPPFQVPSDDGLGHWLLYPAGARDIALGFPTLDATARVAAAKVRNGIISVNAVVAGTESVTLGNTTSASYVDIPSASLSIASAVIGDLITLQASIGMSALTAGGAVALTITNPSAAITIVQALGFIAGSNGTIALCGRFTVTVAGTHTMKLRFNSASGGGTSSAFGQVSLLATLIRP